MCIHTCTPRSWSDTCTDTHTCTHMHTFRYMLRSSCFPTSSGLWENPCWSVIDSALPAPLVCSTVSHTHTHIHTHTHTHTQGKIKAAQTCSPPIRHAVLPFRKVFVHFLTTCFAWFSLSSSLAFHLSGCFFFQLYWKIQLGLLKNRENLKFI